MDFRGRGRAVEEEFSSDERMAAMALLEFERRMREMSEFPLWGSRKKRSKIISASASCRGDFNYDDEMEKEEQEQEQEPGFHETARKRIRAVAAAEDKESKRSRVPETGKKEGSPTTPLSWSGNERGSGSTSGGGTGDRSDTASQAELLLIPAAPLAPPCDRPLGHRPALKVEIGDKVRNPSSRRGPKKMTIPELKEQIKGLSSDREKMEKERKWRLQLLQSLKVENKYLEAQIALCIEKKEAKLPATPPEISSDLAQKTEGSALLKSLFGHVELECSENLDVNSPLVQVMDGTSSIAKLLPPHHVNMNKSGTQDLVVTTKSLSDRYILPDLNIPLELEDSSDSSSGGYLEEALQPNKAVVAAEARKHRKECLRGKYSQSGKARLR